MQERDNIRRRGSCGKPLRRVHRTLHRLFGNSFDIMIYLFLFCRDTKSCSFLIRWCSECAAVQRHKILGRSLIFTKWNKINHKKRFEPKYIKADQIHMRPDLREHKKVNIHGLFSQTQRLKQHHFCETFFPEPAPPPGQVEIFSFFGFWNAPNAWANGALGTVYLSIYNIQDIQRSLPHYHCPLFSNMHVFSLLFSFFFLRFWRNKKSQLMHCRLSLPALPISLFCDAFFAQRSRQIDQYSNSIFQTYFCPNSIFHPPCTAYFRPGRGNQGKFLL